MKTHLIFVIDPMCSWCWGFHPVMEELRAKHSDTFEFSLVVGGLRTKGQMAWNAESKQYLAQNWNAVHVKTKQAFNFSTLNRTHFDYDTYPACKAVVTIRELWGDEASFKYLGKIQEAFYTKGEDITSLETLLYYVGTTPPCLSDALSAKEQQKQKKEAFLKFYNSKRAEILMQHDFAKARSMGANAFPSVVKIDKDDHMMCQSGYRSIEEILEC
ncbi:DsbA family protein [bacterium]|nr:DsbA family protein [bacterium]MBU1957289.1 DsbA family protein [bacterium]